MILYIVKVYTEKEKSESEENCGKLKKLTMIEFRLLSSN